MILLKKLLQWIAFALPLHSLAFERASVARLWKMETIYARTRCRQEAALHLAITTPSCKLPRKYLVHSLTSVLSHPWRRVGTPGLGSKLSTYWHTKWWCDQHTSTDQTPILASPGLNPKGRVWIVDVPALSNQTGLACGVRPIINTATPGLGTSVC